MIERQIYKAAFNKNSHTQWTCPTCRQSLLVIKKDSLIQSEIPSSKNKHNSEEWEPTDIEYRYSCLFECSNLKCKEIITSSGIGYIDDNYCFYQDKSPEQWIERYIPKYFYPHLNIFSCPTNTPMEVLNEISISFELFFCNPQSSANHLRISIEHLLTFLKVNRYTINKYRKRVPIKTHDRIILLPKKYKHIQVLFYAIKWLGNAGSHCGTPITSDDVLDGYEIMEKILIDLFEDKDKNVQNIANEIHKRKGPRK